jgi:hypothetical protein
MAMMRTPQAATATTAHATGPTCNGGIVRLRAIRQLVVANNCSSVPDELIVCQIYMESRFDNCAQAAGSSARGLMQVMQVANRELFRLDNLGKPPAQRRTEPALYAAADAFHRSAAFIDEATNIQVGTRYLQVLIDRATRAGHADPVAEAYRDYRGVRNGVYYAKIAAAAAGLMRDPDAINALRQMGA